MTAVLKPLLPRDAIASLERRGETLALSFAWQDVWQDEHQRRFTVAKSAGHDVLNAIFDGVQDALKDGQTLREFARKLRPLLEVKGWWGRGPALDTSTGVFGGNHQLGSMRRLRTIFDVNMRVSYAQGAWASFERNKATRPFLRYVCVLDGRTRPEHRARHNLILPVDHPYWNIWAPPCGWNCRCTLQQLSQRDIERLEAEGEELMFEPPEDELVQWANARTGTIEMVPKGIDPGWAYNPGRVRAEAAAASDKVIDSPPALGAAGMAAIPPPSVDREFGDWVAAIARSTPPARRSYVIEAIRPEVCGKLAERGVAPASAAILVDQRLIAHALRPAKAAIGRAPTLAMLQGLPSALRNPQAVLLDRQTGKLVYVFPVEGGALRIVIALDFRTTASGRQGRRLPATVNSIRTVDVAQLSDLRNPGIYDLLMGNV